MPVTSIPLVGCVKIGRMTRPCATGDQDEVVWMLQGRVVKAMELLLNAEGDAESLIIHCEKHNGYYYECRHDILFIWLQYTAMPLEAYQSESQACADGGIYYHYALKRHLKTSVGASKTRKRSRRGVHRHSDVWNMPGGMRKYERHPRRMSRRLRRKTVS